MEEVFKEIAKVLKALQNYIKELDKISPKEIYCKECIYLRHECRSQVVYGCELWTNESYCSLSNKSIINENKYVCEHFCKE